jgi:hypothetical protein
MRFLMPLLLTVLLAAPVAAQDKFKQVWVTQADSGEVVRGRMVELSGDSLAILTPDNRRVELRLDRVLRIEAHGDSLANGAGIGAAILGGLTLLGCQGLSRGSQCAAATLFNATFGALAGMGIDAMNGGRSTIYSRPAAVKAGPEARVQLKLRF